MLHNLWESTSWETLLLAYALIGVAWSWLYLPRSLHKAQLRYLRQKEILLSKTSADKETKSLLSSLVIALRWFETAELRDRKGVNLHLQHPTDGSYVDYNGVTDAFEMQRFTQKLVNPSELLELTATFNLRHIFRKRLFHFGFWPVAIVWLTVFTWGAQGLKWLCREVVLPLLKLARKGAIWFGHHVIKPLFIHLRALLKCLYLNIIVRPLKAIWRVVCWCYTHALIPLLQSVHSAIRWSIRKALLLAKWLYEEIGIRVKNWCVACYTHALLPISRALKRALVYTWAEAIVPMYKCLRYCAHWLRDSFDRLYSVAKSVLHWLWQHTIVAFATFARNCLRWLWLQVLVPVAKTMRDVLKWLFDNVITRSLKLCWRAVAWSWNTIVRPFLRILIDLAKWSWNTIVVRLWQLGVDMIVWLWREVIKRGIQILHSVCSWVWRHLVLALFTNLYKALKRAYTCIQPLLRMLKDCFVDIEKTVAKLFSYAWSRVVMGISAVYSVFAYLYRWIISWANREAISDLKKLEKETK